LYVDIDVHHGDGVEEAFYMTDRYEMPDLAWKTLAAGWVGGREMKGMGRSCLVICLNYLQCAGSRELSWLLEF
jgi:hypothetical protein